MYAYRIQPEVSACGRFACLTCFVKLSYLLPQATCLPFYLEVTTISRPGQDNRDCTNISGLEP